MITHLYEIIPLVESQWRNVRALIVGDVMLDKYIWGEVDRISPEAPVPVVRNGWQDEQPGGAANVAINMASLGAKVTVAGFGGGDKDQQQLESLLAQAGIQATLSSVPGIPTTTKLRILCGHQHMLRLDTEGVPKNCQQSYDELLDGVMAILPSADVVVLSDYAKGVLTEQVCRAIIDEAREFQIPVLVDPKNRNFTRYRGATTICPNLNELASATGESKLHPERVLVAGQALLPWLGLKYMAVTLSDKGIAVLRDRSRVQIPAIARQVYDVSGAGDTVIAVLALALASNVEIETAAEVANLAAGIVVGKPGTVPIYRHELLAALTQDVAVTKEDKVLPLTRLLWRVAAWRVAGQRVVFTNGCFDLLHIGHIRLLELARRKGDRLIVAINSDESVRSLKGNSRPCVTAADRAQILAALGVVDAVVVFDDETPLSVIEAVRPDVLVKGADYTDETVVGAQQVRSWGGTVELIPMVEGASTTALIGRAISHAGDCTSMPEPCDVYKQ